MRCHEAAPTIEERVFAGTPAECAGCHADAHRGAFDGFENEAGCAHCHRPSEFHEYDEGAFEHGGWTGFRLEGAHFRAECESCHARSAAADEHGRTFGFAAELFPGHLATTLASADFRALGVGRLHDRRIDARGRIDQATVGVAGPRWSA